MYLKEEFPRKNTGKKLHLTVVFLTQNTGLKSSANIELAHPYLAGLSRGI